MKLLSCCLLVAGMFVFPGEIRAQQNLAMAARPQAIPFQLEGGFLIEVEGGVGHINAQSSHPGPG